MENGVSPAGAGRLGALLALLVLAACSTHHAAPRPASRVLGDCEKPSYEPKTILLACGDGSVSLADVKYKSWTATSATGTATVMANDFTPNRAQGHEHPYPATFVLDQVQKDNGVPVFSRALIVYTGKAPYGQKAETYQLYANDAGSGMS